MKHTVDWAILGSGAWGTALGVHLSQKGFRVQLVCRRSEQAEVMRAARVNATYLPGIQLPEALEIQTPNTVDWSRPSIYFLACPTKGLAEWISIIHTYAHRLQPSALFICLCKGLEPSTLITPVAYFTKVFPNYHCGVLSGPNNAHQVAAGMPTAAVLALNTSAADAYPQVHQWIHSETLRVYHSSDVIGVELGGCLKNIYAIGAGICDALKLGDNAKAAYVTRVVAEMTTIGLNLGGQTNTFYGLSGLGDLIATCYGPWSRNRQFGEHIGNGLTPESILTNHAQVVEGYASTLNFRNLCIEYTIECPVLEEIYKVLYENKPAHQGIKTLMCRELKTEA